MKVLFFIIILQEAMAKDIADKSTEPDINMKAFLTDAYLHPIFRSFEEEELVEVRVDKVRVDRHQSYADKDQTSDLSSPSPHHHVYHDHTSSPPHHSYQPTSPPQDVYHHGLPPQYAYNLNSSPQYGYHYEVEP